MRINTVLAVALVALCPAAVAQSMQTPHTLKLDESGNMPSASVGDLAWMAGHWKGDFLGGTAEEVWTPPSGGSMLGMFKLVQSDAASFYELMTLVEENGSVILKLKHFNPDLSGWEEKGDHVAFPLVKLAENAAYFDGLTFERVSDDTLKGYLVMETADGPKEVAFTYRLVD